MKKITLNALALLVTCCLWQVSAQTFPGAGGISIPASGTGGFPCTGGPIVSDAAATSTSGTAVIGTNVGDYTIDMVELNAVHSFAADMDVTLIAPDGTTTLDLFLDDGGSTGLDTAATIVLMDGSTNLADEWNGGAPPVDMAPEAGLLNTVFAGQSVDGNWTLSICDDASGDSGTLNSYSITLSENLMPPPVGACATDTPTTIVDFTTITSELTLAGLPTSVGPLTGETTLNFASLAAEHDTASDFRLTLTSPSGMVLIISENNGGTQALTAADVILFNDTAADNVTTWAGGAPAVAGYLAEGGLLNATFAGEDPNGTWILSLEDTAILGNGATSELSAFCMEAIDNGTVGTVPTISCPADVTVDSEPGIGTANVVFADAAAIDAEDGGLTTTNTSGPVSGSDFPVGATVITFEATDSDGNTVTCDFTITVEDNEDPVAVCQDITIELDEFGDATIVESDIDGGSSDNDGFTLGASQLTFGCSDVGDVVVTLTVTDTSGNTDTCDATVTVEDNITPVIVCEGQVGSVTYSDAPGDAITTASPPVVSVVSVTEAAALDDVDVVLDINHTWVGDLTITLESPAGTVVTIFDGPVDGCRGDDLTFTLDDESTNTLSGTCNDVNPGLAYDLSNYMPSNALSAFDGEDTMGDWTLTVADGVAGDTGTLNSWDLVLSSPDLALPPLEVVLDPVTGEATIDPTDLIVSADDACGVTISAGGSTGGAFTPTCDLASSIDDDAISAQTWDRPIAAGPAISALGPVSFHVYGPFTVDTDGLYTFDSDQDGGSWDGYIHLYETAFDPTDQLTNLIAGNDDGPGGAGTSQILDISLVMGTEYFLVTSGFGAGDFGSFTNTITGAGTATCTPVMTGITFTCADVGNNEIEVTVTDPSGNESTCFANVNVVDNTAPVVVCQDIDIEIGEDGTATLDPMDLIDTTLSVEACGFDVVTADIVDFDCSNVGTPVMVTLFVNDPSGNIASCTAMVTAVDLLGPAIEGCPTDDVLVNVAGGGSDVYTMEDFTTGVTAVDNCGGTTTTITQDPPVGTTFGVTVGTPNDPIVVTLTSTDDMGNVGTCTFNLSVGEELGVNENDFASGLVLYPNPAEAVVTLANRSSQVLESATIYDINGKLVQNVDLTGMQTERSINVANLASGVYVVQIKGANATASKRLIKK